MPEPFKFSNGQIAYNINDLVTVCSNYPENSGEYFLRGDFEGWLNYIGLESLAAKASEIRQRSDIAEQQKLAEFIASCQPISVEPEKPLTSEQPKITKSSPPSPERVEKRYRIVYLPGFTQVRQTSMAQKEQIVPYQIFSKQLQLINKTGGKIVDIQPV